MKVPRAFSSACVAVVVMFLLSVTVQPVMAAGGMQNQIGSGNLDDFDAITIEESASGPTGIFSPLPASPSDDILEYKNDNVSMRVHDPLAGQSIPNVQALRTGSGGDEVDARIAETIVSLDREGYDLTGQTDHQYRSVFESEKFRALDSQQRARLESQGQHLAVGDHATLTTQETVTYYIFTNRTTNATRLMIVAQIVDAEGKPVGERKMQVSEDIARSDSDSVPRLGMAIPVVFIIVLICEIIFVLLGCKEDLWHCGADPTPVPTIPVTPLPTTTPIPHSASNVVMFGTAIPTKWPSGYEYSRLGGMATAIKRDGSVDLFLNKFDLPGNDWVDITWGGAIRTDGTLVTWSPNSTAIVNTYDPKVTGKKYVAVSRFVGGDWMLAIYEDKDGNSRIDIFYKEVPLDASHPYEANEFKALHPQIYSGWPKDTGWSMISAGNNHALAILSDGRLYAWGNNDYHQLNLLDDPNAAFVDIAAGMDFSLGLRTTVFGTGDLVVVANGRNDYNQVSDMKGLPAGKYLAVEACRSRSAVIAHDGTIISGGEPWTGSQPPNDAGYTDIVLGPNFGFALKENAKEKEITGAISPENVLAGQSGSGWIEPIPVGSTLRHTHNEVTRIFAPNGTELFWLNDADSAAQVRFPSGAMLPTSLIHYVRSSSTVDARTDYQATVGNPSTGGGTELTVNEDAWYDESGPDIKPTLPRAICFADIGCSVGTAAKQHLFLSDPIEAVAPAATAGGYTPVLSVRQIDNGTWVGTLGVLGSTNPADTVTLTQKKRPTDPDPPLRFTLVSGNWSHEPGTNMWMDAKADLTSENAVLHYTGTATASKGLPSITITPKIWREESTGNVLVYTGSPATCTNTNTCTIAGDFTPVWDIANVTGTFVADLTMVYSLPAADVAANNLDFDKVAVRNTISRDVPVKEVVVTGPLSQVPPGTVVRAEDANNTVPWGGTIEHVIDGDVPMTVVYDASGNPQSWADDTKAVNFSITNVSTLPTSRTYLLPSATLINWTSEEQITATNSFTGEKILSVVSKKSSLISSVATIYPTIFCKKNFGCTVADLASTDIYIAQPFSDTVEYIPMGIFNNFDDENWSATLCRTDSSDLYNCTTSERTTLISRSLNRINISAPGNDIFPIVIYGYGRLKLDNARYDKLYKFSTSVWWAAMDLSTVPSIKVQTFLEKRDSSGDYPIFNGEIVTYTNVGLIEKKDKHEYTPQTPGCYFVSSWSHWTFAPGWDPAEGVYVANSSGLCYT